MTKRTVLIAAGCGAVLAATAAAVAVAAAFRPRTPEARPPEVGGQPAPSAVRVIDFTRRYDAYCEFFRDAPTVFRGCKVVGFTGPDEPTAGDRSGGSYLLSSGSGSGSGYRYFDRWLVLELSDGRLAYVPPSAVKYLEAAKEP